MDVERCGRLSVHDGLGDVAWFCVCKLGWFVGGGSEYKFCGGGWCKCEWLGYRRVCVEVV